MEMATLTLTSMLVTENDLASIPETVRIYSAAIDGRTLSDRWVVPQSAVEATAQAEFTAHLTTQGYIFN